MTNNRRIQQMNQGIRDFVDQIKQNCYAVDSVELCIIAFGGDNASVIQRFASVKGMEYSDLQASGRTHLGQAVEMALRELQICQKRYGNYGISSYKPWIILLSDGAATDSIAQPSRDLRSLQKQGKVKVMCVGMGDERNDLAQFSLSGEVINENEFRLHDFFAWLSKSMTEQSKASPNEDIELPKKNRK
jgi:uncharacterized protein YegL